jgi:hypothetical protein
MIRALVEKLPVMITPRWVRMWTQPIAIDVELDVCGFLAPAAERLAEAGVPLIPQCAYLKDHLLIHEKHLRLAQAELEELIAWARR